MWNKPEQWAYDWKKAYCHLASGLCVGMSGLASGMTIGICGDAGVRGMLHRDILIAVILLMIFAEAIALFGFIVGVVLAQS
jgi:V-type H+-transporting ATPase proteolipid subunit